MITEVSSDAFNIMIEKPRGWEYLLFGQVLKDELGHSKELRKDLSYGITLGTGRSFGENILELTGWIKSQLDYIQRIVSNIEPIINVAFQEAVGKPGEPGNERDIVYVAKRLGGVFRELINWSIEFKRVSVPSEWKTLLSNISTFSLSSIEDIEAFSEKYSLEIKKALSTLQVTGKQVVLEMTLKLRSPDTSGFSNELQRLTKLYVGQ